MVHEAHLRSHTGAVKLSEWAQRQRVSSLTAWRWVKAGILPVRARQLPAGTLLVDEPPRPGRTVLYARVSSVDQREDLGWQGDRTWAEDWGVRDPDVVTEVGSGLTGKRRRVMRLLRGPSVGLIVVEHHRRLARVGFERVEAAPLGSGRRIAVLDPLEVEDDLVRDRAGDPGLTLRPALRAPLGKGQGQEGPAGHSGRARVRAIAVTGSGSETLNARGRDVRPATRRAVPDQAGGRHRLRLPGKTGAAGPQGPAARNGFLHFR